MRPLLVAVDQEHGPIQLPAWLGKLLSAGLVEQDGALLFREYATQPGSSRDSFLDLTGYEAFINHFHLDANDGGLDDLRVAVAAVDQIAQLAADTRREQTVRIALSRNLAGPYVNSTVRFYRLRPGEVWVVDDLESYEHEAVGFVDVVVSLAPETP